MTARIFLSYKHGDPSTRIARTVCDHLEAYGDALGVSVFMDDRQLVAADEWRRRVDKELASMTHFLALLDTAYWLSGECRRELNWAHQRYVASGSPKLLFVQAQTIRPDLMVLGTNGQPVPRTKSARIPRVADFHFLGPFDASVRLQRLMWEEPGKLMDQVANLIGRLEATLPTHKQDLE